MAGMSGAAPMVVEKRPTGHNDWIVPRRVMCAFFWIGIILLFTGIILLVTSKHKGGTFQSWGAILLGLGFCLLLICLILCLHAYCVITVIEDHPRAKKQLPSSSQSIPLMNGQKPVEFTGNTHVHDNGGLPNGRRGMDAKTKPLQVIVIEKDQERRDLNSPNKAHYSSPKLSHSGTLLTDSRFPVQTVIPPGDMYTDHHVECQIPTSLLTSVAPLLQNLPPGGANSPYLTLPAVPCHCSREEECTQRSASLPAAAVTANASSAGSSDNTDGLSAREMIMAQENKVNMHRDSAMSQLAASESDFLSQPLLMSQNSVIYTNPTSLARQRCANHFAGNIVRLSPLGEPQTRLMHSNAAVGPMVEYGNRGQLATSMAAPQRQTHMGATHCSSMAYPSARDWGEHCNPKPSGQYVNVPGAACSTVYSTLPVVCSDPLLHPASPVRSKPPFKPGLAIQHHHSDVTISQGFMHPVMSPVPPRSVFTNIPPHDDFVRHPRPTRLAVGARGSEVQGSQMVPEAIPPGNPGLHQTPPGNRGLHQTPPVVVYVNPMEYSDSKISIYDNLQYAWGAEKEDPHYTLYTEGSKTYCDI